MKDLVAEFRGRGRDGPAPGHPVDPASSSSPPPRHNKTRRVGSLLGKTKTRRGGGGEREREEHDGLPRRTPFSAFSSSSSVQSRFFSSEAFRFFVSSYLLSAETGIAGIALLASSVMIVACVFLRQHSDAAALAVQVLFFLPFILIASCLAHRSRTIEHVRPFFSPPRRKGKTRGEVSASTPRADVVQTSLSLRAEGM